MLVGLPVVIYALLFLCDENGCPPSDLSAAAKALGSRSLGSFFSGEAFIAEIAWFVFLAVLWYVLPGQWAKGVVLPSKSGREERLLYKMNGFSSLVVSMLVLALASASGLVRLSWLHDNYLELASASIVLSLAMSVLLFAFSPSMSSEDEDRPLSHTGATGYMLYDFFMGRELNPRLSIFGHKNFDLKQFCELRPGLIGWAILNAGMAAKQHELHGHVTASMVLVNVFQLYYVVDALWNEQAILTTMDITTDGFGVMLAFGDLAWVPFTYSLQARYLVSHPVDLSLAAVAGIVALKLVGLCVFRGANSQKNMFRKNPAHPSVSHLKSMDTKRGTKLIISGWWGVARHINYTGDWLMAWAWCLPCGFGSPIPYFYVVYFGFLLVHRELRDEENCAHKYGKDWARYCEIVPYRLIPYVY